MNREPWVVYLVVIGVVALMVYGKFLMGGGAEENSKTTKKEEEKKD
jgi:hypothetical protein